MTLYPMPVGDGGGGAVGGELVAIAIAVARAVEAPLCADDARRDRAEPRRRAARRWPRGSARWPMRRAGWRAGTGASPGRRGSTPRWRGRGARRCRAFVARGAVPPYAAAAMRIEAASVALPIACGYLRGDVEPLTAFANESFIDELARARGVEPLAFRIGLLGGQPRLARALSEAAARGGWDGGARGKLARDRLRGGVRQLHRPAGRGEHRARPAHPGDAAGRGGRCRAAGQSRAGAAAGRGRVAPCPGQRDRRRARDHRRHAARAPARRARAADAQGPAQGRGGAAAERCSRRAGSAGSARWCWPRRSAMRSSPRPECACAACRSTR